MPNGLRWKIAQGFEIRWWRNYLKKKDPAEYQAWKKVYWKGYLERMGADVPLRPGDRILDAGCGPAGIFLVLGAYRPHALDPLLDEYEKLPHFKRADHPDVTFSQDTLEDYSSEELFDTVFCMNAVNHVDNLTRAYDSLAARTRSGGTIVLTIDAHNSGFWKSLFRLIPGDILHPHQYDEREYAGMLERRGFTLVSSHVMERDFFFSRVMQIARKL